MCTSPTSRSPTSPGPSAATSGARAMPRPFARHYDAIYADKDYGRDLAALEALLEGRALRNGRLLELGAGTGNHTLRLAPRVGELASVEIDRDFAEVLSTKVAAAGARNVRVYSCP